MKRANPLTNLRGKLWHRCGSVDPHPPPFKVIVLRYIYSTHHRKILGLEKIGEVKKLKMVGDDLIGVIVWVSNSGW